MLCARSDKYHWLCNKGSSPDAGADFALVDAIIAASESCASLHAANAATTAGSSLVACKAAILAMAALAAAVGLPFFVTMSKREENSAQYQLAEVLVTE